MVFTNLKKKIIGTAALIGALTVLGGYLLKPVSWYKEYKEDVRIEKELELKQFVVEVYYEISNGIIEETTREISTTKRLLDSLENVILDIQQGNEYFAVGYRGNGSGKLWYRDVYGKIHELFYWEETNQYYYINEEGRAVYL